MISLNDGKPWFRRWMWIGVKAIAPEGMVVQSVMALGAILFGYLAIKAPGGTWQEIIFSGLFLVVAIGGCAVIFTKLEGDF